MSWTLARMEWRRLLRSPLAWVLLALAPLLLAWQFLQALETFSGLPAAQRRLGLSAYLGLQSWGFAAVLLLFLTPIVTMRSFSEPLRNGSFSLLSSAPLSLPAVLLGKYLGCLLFLLLLLALPLLMSLSIAPGTQLDWGLLAAASLGLALLTACFAAVGIYFSILGTSPAVAVAGSYGLLLLLTLLSPDSTLGGAGLLRWFAWPGHYLGFQLGQLRAVDLAYFLLLTALFLALALHRLERRRRA